MAVKGVKAVTGGRYLMPEAADKNSVLMVRLADSSWQKRDFMVNGSYLVFPMDGTETGFALYNNEGTPWYWYAIGGTMGALAVVVITLLKKKKK